MTKLTDWFPAHIKPVRKGWYDTNVPTLERFVESPDRWYWNGKYWLFTKTALPIVGLQDRMWRGIAK